MQLVPVRSNAERREAGSQEANAEQAFISLFNAELAHAQRDAIQALREIIADNAGDAADDEANLDDDTRRTRAIRRQSLSIRLRAATALLRVKPIAVPTLPVGDILPVRAPSARPGSKAQRGTPDEASSKPRNEPPVTDRTTASPHPQQAGAAQPRTANSPHHGNSKHAPDGAPPTPLPRNSAPAPQSPARAEAVHAV